MNKWQRYFMDVAIRTAQLSHCKRSQVGAVAVRDKRIICVGYNGTSPGEDNCCEDEHNITKPNVIHAEDNLIRFAKRNNIDISGTNLYTTLAPCKSCASLILSADFSEVFYLQQYRFTDGLDFLQSVGISTTYLGV